MHTSLAEQPPVQEQHEQRKSFDVLASVYMFRYDLEHFGQVLPETRERVCDEELSLLSEGVDRAACTEFALKRQGDDLQYFKNGEWQSYAAMLLTGREVAAKEAQKDPRKQFLAEDAVNDLYRFGQMRKLQPGEQHVWFSTYRKDVEQKFGKDFMQSCGRFPGRQMGFIYRAYCTEEGDVILQSQTVDRSDDDAFTAALDAAAQNPTISMPQLVEEYDGVLKSKHGGDFYAGRKDAEVDENAWQVILAQKDLIQYFIARLETIAVGTLYGQELEEATKRHMYGVWAAFKKRLDAGAQIIQQTYAPDYVPGQVMSVTSYAMVSQEVYAAYTEFAAAGMVLIGCGGSISVLMGERDILNASPADVFSAIMGRKDEDGPDGKGPLVFKCKNGHWNRRRPFAPLLKRCRVSSCAKGSVGC